MVEGLHSLAAQSSVDSAQRRTNVQRNDGGKVKHPERVRCLVRKPRAQPPYTFYHSLPSLLTVLAMLPTSRVSKYRIERIISFAYPPSPSFFSKLVLLLIIPFELHGSRVRRLV